MSFSSYTASERRGILAIALVALLIIGSGVAVSLFGNSDKMEAEVPEVVSLPEMVDSVAVKAKEESKKGGNKTKKSKKNSSKTNKTYRKRNPLEEPV